MTDGSAGEPATLPGVLAALEALPPGRGAVAATALLAGLAGSVAAEFPGPARSGEGEFAATVTVELTRRYLRAVHGHARRERGPAVWGLVLGGAGSLAAVALLDHDLPIAVVGACTLLGQPPGPLQRRRTAALAAWIAAAGGVPAGTGCWAQVERLWAVRGRPAAADAERAALDRWVRAAAMDRPDPPADPRRCGSTPPGTIRG